MSSTQSRGLNPEQELAVTWGDGPMMVLAGAGTGKTRVLVHRIAHLVQSGAPAWSILAVTFTNKAAKEMRDRLRQLLGEAANEMSIGTFHATSARLLRGWGSFVEVRKGFAIFDDDDQVRLVDRILKDHGLAEQVSPRTLLSLFDRAKNRGEDPVRASANHHFGDIVEKVFPRYKEQLHKENAVDFNDLLLKALELTKHPDIGQRVRTRYSHILVDEFQDTNRVQYDLVCGLAATRNLMVVGDDDQSIYGWRGAEPKNLLDFDRDFPDAKIIKLEQNYRSTQVVLDAANSVIAKNRDRRGKELWTEQTGGDLIETYFAGDERGEAYYIARKIREMIDEGPYSASDFAVLYRTNAQSRVLEEHMRAVRVPARVVGAMSFYERKEVKDAIAYLRLLVNPSADSAFDRIVNVPARGIGDTTVERLRKAAAELAEEEARGGGAEEVEEKEEASRSRGGGTLFSQLLDEAAARRKGEGVKAAEAPDAAASSAKPAADAAPSSAGASATDEPPPPLPPARLGPSMLEMCRAAGRGEVAGVATAARKKLAGFADLIDGLCEVMAAGASVAEILIQIVERSGLREKLEKEDSPESRDRLTNLAELVSTASDFDDETGEQASVEDFLERIALSSNSDQSASPEQVTLTTIHVAKGLEFPIVFLSGWEDGLFPSLREREGQDEDLALEEERRLAYVALTRAKQKLILTMARTRRVWGEIRMQSPSRFFDDIPDHCSLAPTRAQRQADRPRDYQAELRSMNMGSSGAGGMAARGGGMKRSSRRSYDEYDQRTHEESEPVFQVESYDDEASVAGPSSGSKVNHAAFGVGRVVATSGSGRDLKVTVDFPSVGEKTVLARYLLRN